MGMAPGKGRGKWEVWKEGKREEERGKGMELCPTGNRSLAAPLYRC